MATVDEYIKTVIKPGDAFSELAAQKCAPTLKNSELVDVVEDGMNGLAVLRIPAGYYVVVHSTGGDPKEKDPARHAASMVRKLTQQAWLIGVKPSGLANVIDARTGDLGLMETVLDAMVGEANKRHLPILNGETAILGERVEEVNISGTMISIASKRRVKPGVFTYKGTYKGVTYAVFDPEGKPVYINSDGVGTKTDPYERATNYPPAQEDGLAMKLDDLIKKGATAKAVSDVVETRGAIPFSELEKHARELSTMLGIEYMLQQEEVGSRIKGYKDDVAAYNISGSAVSTIDEERLRNQPKPSAGELMVAIRGKPNPRSNGITSKRAAMEMLFGREWHLTEEGKPFLEYLTAPSTILYPVFKELMDAGTATSVYHMSGGAYNGKLAKPIAKHGLFAGLENLFPPDWREWTFVGATYANPETAYAKWPMGNDGFVTTQEPEKAMDAIRKHGLEARVVGKIEQAADGRTGIEITLSSGGKVYFSGR